jgi:hypothetical protein
MGKGSEMKILGILARSLFFVCISWTLAFAGNYLVRHENGIIDWTNGVLEAFAYVRAPESFENEAQARSLAKAGAIAEARRNLLNILEEMDVTAEMRLKDLQAKDPFLEREIRSLVQRAYLSDLSYRNDGSVKATLSMKILGLASEIIIPPWVKSISPIESQTTKKGAGEASTGLIFDCRGLRQKAVLVPRAVDEEGREIYGPSFASRENVVRLGIAGWICGMEDALKDWRAGERPLVVKAIAGSHGGKNVRLANADAEKIRKDARNLDLMRQCRIIIVLD